MIYALEAKRMSRDNKMKIEAKRVERLIKDIENRILTGIDGGWGYIEINPELSCLSEIEKHFDALGYKIFRVLLRNEQKVYIVWDEEAWTKELGFEEKKTLEEEN